jgi:Holliday junction resolvase RusA-like endonuclease
VSVRKRFWSGGKEAWVVDFKDATGKRRLRTFATKKDADQFAAVVKAVHSGQIPEPPDYRPLEFTSEFPFNRWNRNSGRAAVINAFRASFRTALPTTDGVIVHVIAEMPLANVIADVENLLKPVLDALKGVAWVDDAQVNELLVRRVPAPRRRLRVKVWQIPGPVIAAHSLILTKAGLRSGRAHVGPQARMEDVKG